MRRTSARPTVVPDLQCGSGECQRCHYLAHPGCRSRSIDALGCVVKLFVSHLPPRGCATRWFPTTLVAVPCHATVGCVTLVAGWRGNFSVAHPRQGRLSTFHLVCGTLKERLFSHQSPCITASLFRHSLEQRCPPACLRKRRAVGETWLSPVH